MTTTDRSPTPRADGMIVLDRADCYLRLRSCNLGRVGVSLAGDLVILPVYYAVIDGDIVFRTAPGAKLSAALLKTKIAFEADGAAPGWSVLVRGHAEEVRDVEMQTRARTALGYDWPAGDHEHIVRLQAEQVTGRLLPPGS